MTTKERLKQYIEKDEIYQNYKQNKLMNSNDFDKFCIQHCKDIEELLEENQELKKQVEEINKMIEKCGFANIEQVMLNYCGLLVQQKEFIKWLEEKEKQFNGADPRLAGACSGILQKYKNIIGDVKNENNNV